VNTDTNQASAQNKTTLDRVLDLVVTTGAKGGVNKQAMEARLRLSMRGMKQQIENSCANWDISSEDMGVRLKE
jgi:hypothetical protein